MSTDENGRDPDAPLDDEAPPASISDPEEYVDTRRLRDIFDARAELREVRLRSAYRRDADARAAYRAAVSSYVSEVEPLFLEDERGLWWWEKAELATAKIRPKYSETRRGFQIEGHGRPRPQLNNPPTPSEIELVGVKSIFELPTPLQGTLQYVDDSGFGTESLETLTFTRRMPFSAADAYGRATNRFLASIGLEADVDDSASEAELRVGDVLPDDALSGNGHKP